MPRPTIPSFSTFNFTAGQFRKHSIPIGNRPTWGLGFLSWDTFLIQLVGSNLEISGTPTRIGTFRGNFNVGNSDGSASANLTVSVSAVVSPPQPVFRPSIVHTTLNIRAGVDYTANPIRIRILNNPRTVSLSGLAIGLSWRFRTDGISGIEIIGTAPSIRNLSSNQPAVLNTTVDIFAANSAGSDSEKLSITYRS